MNILSAMCYYNWKSLKRIEKLKWAYWGIMCLCGIGYIISMIAIIDATKSNIEKTDIVNRYSEIMLGIIVLSVLEIMVISVRYGMNTIIDIKTHIYPFPNWLNIMINQCSIMIDVKILLWFIFGLCSVVIFRTQIELINMIAFISLIYLCAGIITIFIGIFSQLLKMKSDNLSVSSVYQVVALMGVFLSLIPSIATKEIFHTILVSMPIAKNAIFGIQAVMLNDWTSILWNLVCLSLYFGIGIILYMFIEHILRNR